MRTVALCTLVVAALCCGLSACRRESASWPGSSGSAAVPADLRLYLYDAWTLEQWDRKRPTSRTRLYKVNDPTAYQEWAEHINAVAVLRGCQETIIGKTLLSRSASNSRVRLERVGFCGNVDWSVEEPGVAVYSIAVSPDSRSLVVLIRQDEDVCVKAVSADDGQTSELARGMFQKVVWGNDPFHVWLVRSGDWLDNKPTGRIFSLDLRSRRVEDFCPGSDICALPEGHLVVSPDGEFVSVTRKGSYHRVKLPFSAMWAVRVPGTGGAVLIEPGGKFNVLHWFDWTQMKSTPLLDTSGPQEVAVESGGV